MQKSNEGQLTQDQKEPTPEVPKPAQLENKEKPNESPQKTSPSKISSTFSAKKREEELKSLKFQQTNPFQGSQYHNMTAVVGLPKHSTNSDVLEASMKSMNRISSMMKSQKSQEYLALNNLPNVPEYHSPPKLIIAKDKKTISYYKAQNDAHGRTTNGGFKRTEYGGFFMH